MYVSGLQIGLSTADLREMPLMRLAAMLAACSFNAGGESDGDRDGKPRTRKATQADIEKMLY